MGASTPKSRPAGTLLEELVAKLNKKQGGAAIGAKEGAKEIGASKSVKGKKSSNFGTPSFMSEEGSSEEEEAIAASSVGKEPRESPQSRVEESQNWELDLVSKANENSGDSLRECEASQGMHIVSEARE